MPKSRAVTVDSIRVGDLILLNDLASSQRLGTFYRECYKATDDGAVIATDLQVAEVLETSHIADAYRIEVRTNDDRILDLEVHTDERFSVLTPNIVTVENVQVGDEILLRGEYSPTHLNKSYKYALIAHRYGHISKVLTIRKTWQGDYRVTVLFARVKKLTLTVDPGVEFEDVSRL